MKEDHRRPVLAGLQVGRQKQLRTISKLAARRMSAAEIAEILGLEIELVRKTLAKAAE